MRDFMVAQKQGRHRGLPLQGYDPMNWEIANCGIEKMRWFRISPFAFHNSDARIMAVIDFKPMHNIRQSHCRGNPLWLPKNKGRHVERSNVY
jgi:hypothetical protein